MLLKGRNHPTFDKGVEVDRRLGYGLEMKDGRYYTRPFERYQSGGVINWVSSLFGDGGPKPMTPEEIEKRSWDRDPYIKPMPTEDDAFAAARYKRAHGDPNISAIDIGDDYQRQTARGFGEQASNPSKMYPPRPKKKLSPDEADYLRIGQLQANQTPVSYGRMEPGKVVLPPDYKHRYNVVGMTDPTTRDLWLDKGWEGYAHTPAHEASHAGYEDIYEAPESKGLPAGRQLMHEMQNRFITRTDLNMGLGLHELVVRANMQRHFGDVENVSKEPVSSRPDPKGDRARYQRERAAELLRNPEFVKYMRQLDRLGAYAGAQRNIERAGGVYKRGGPVLQTGSAR